MQLLEENFTAGLASPAYVIVEDNDVSSPEVQSSVADLIAALEPDAAFAPPYNVIVNQDGNLLYVEIPLAASVDENEAALAVGAAQAGRARHHLLDLLDARGHGRERHEAARGDAGEDLGERRLAASRRSPEDERRHPVLGDGTAQERAFAHHVGLSDDLVEGPGTEPLGERCARRGRRAGGAPPHDRVFLDGRWWLLVCGTPPALQK